MKLHQDEASGSNQITACGEDYVAVNQVRFSESLIVLPQRLVQDWDVAQFDALTARHFEALLELSPELVILGTGSKQRFPHPKLMRSLFDAGIGVEVMSLSAACRTYNILMDEGRKVAAALIIDRPSP
ncbi:MAG: Xcc1710-like domain-containing protein [Burkholderiales bacterium]|nr:Xcc1710-like domain-containing protein [Burkholderiales bacterium]